MKEEEFLRQVHKLDSEQKADAKRLQERYESMMASRNRENERSLQELEDKLTHAQDECDEHKRNCDRLQKQVWEYKRDSEDR